MMPTNPSVEGTLRDRAAHRPSLPRWPARANMNTNHKHGPASSLSGPQLSTAPSTRKQSGHHLQGDMQLLHRGYMKFHCVEFSWRAAFIGLYLTP